MDSLTRDDLRVLIEAEGEWCVSLFMPMMRAGMEVQQNTIRFKNLIRQAEEKLRDLEMRTPDIEQLLSPAVEMLDDADLWRHQSDGLAVFLSAEHTSSYRLPVVFEELVVVQRRFHIKPLIPFFSGDGQFYVLALSKDRVRFLICTRNSAQELALPDVPESLAAALSYDHQPQRQLRAVGSGEGAVFHGQGAGGDSAPKQELLRYFQMVARGVHAYVADKTAPLVLAGVDYLLPIYREANTYPHLVPEGVSGNPDVLSAKELQQRAWAVMKPYFEQAQAEQAALFEELAGQNDARAVHALKDVVRAAHEGRMATLFVPRHVQQWGQYRAHSHKVHVHPTQQPGDHDLIDLAAAQTIANGGVVYVVDRDEMPGGDLVAAILRY